MVCSQGLEGSSLIRAIESLHIPHLNGAWLYELTSRMSRSRVRKCPISEAEGRSSGSVSLLIIRGHLAANRITTTRKKSLIEPTIGVILGRRKSPQWEAVSCIGNTYSCFFTWQKELLVWTYVIYACIGRARPRLRQWASKWARVVPDFAQFCPILHVFCIFFAKTFF